MGSIIQRDITPPGDLTFRHVLYALYAMQHWECVRQPADGPYKQGYFYNQIHPVLRGLGQVSRETALRHHQTGVCVACLTPVDLTRTRLDHIIPLAKGGKDDLSNALLLCRPCNSSKGTKDLLDWWIGKAYDPSALDRAVLCLYTRIQWQWAKDQDMAAACTPAQRRFLAGRAAALPTADHHIALYGSMYAGCALSSWLAGSDQHD